jgi:sugar/nucleoside kinase (ribokinase family)
MQPLDCLFIGSATYDMLMLIGEVPASDQRIAAKHMVITPGGPAATAAAAFHALGGKCGLESAIGCDTTGFFIQDNLNNIGFEYMKLHTVNSCASSTSMIQVEFDGKRCITHFGGCIDRLPFSEINQNILHNTRCVHLAGTQGDLTLDVARYCKENTQALVSVDGGNYSRKMTDHILPYTDIFIPDDKTAKNTLGLTPEDACHYYYDHGPGIVCVTKGPDGSVGFDGTTMYPTEALKVEVVDTTGAGDNYHGAFLYAYLRGMSLEKAFRFSGIFSSMSCRGLGGREMVPSLDEVMAMISEEL